MTWRPHPLPPVPEATAAAVQAAFPKGNLDVDLHTELGAISDAHFCAAFSADRGPPVAGAPWRLALATLMQSIAGRTDRQTAAAVRRGLDWQYALSLERTDPGCDCTLLHDFRQRWLTHDGAQRVLDTLLDRCKARGWIRMRGTPRPDSTSGVAAIRRLYSLEGVQAAMHDALNQLSEAAPQWVQERAPLEWDERDGPRADLWRLPQETSKRQALARTIGADGSQRMAWLSQESKATPLCELPAVEMLRPIWLQHLYRCTEPGMEAIRWRDTADQPPTAPLLPAPYDLEARSGTKRAMHWVGDKVHRRETCEEDSPPVITPVTTTLAPTSDCVLGEPIAPD